MLGGAASPAASGRACKHGEQRQEAAARAPGDLPAEGAAQPLLGWEGDPRPDSPSAKQPGTGDWHDQARHFPTLVVCQAHRGLCSALSLLGTESCLGTEVRAVWGQRKPPWARRDQARSPSGKRQKPHVLRPPGKQGEKYCKGTWDLRWPWTPALGTESPAAAYAACPHACNCTDERDPTTCVRNGPRACEAPPPHWAGLWLQRGSPSFQPIHWRFLEPCSRGCDDEQRLQKPATKAVGHRKYKTMGFLQERCGQALTKFFSRKNPRPWACHYVTSQATRQVCRSQKRG